MSNGLGSFDQNHDHPIINNDYKVHTVILKSKDCDHHSWRGFVSFLAENFFGPGQFGRNSPAKWSQSAAFNHQHRQQWLKSWLWPRVVYFVIAFISKENDLVHTCDWHPPRSQSTSGWSADLRPWHSREQSPFSVPNDNSRKRNQPTKEGGWKKKKTEFFWKEERRRRTQRKKTFRERKEAEELEAITREENRATWRHSSPHPI